LHSFFQKNTPISWTLYFFGFLLEWNGSNQPGMDPMWKASQSSKKCFQTGIRYYYILDLKSLQEHWIIISRTRIYFHMERGPPPKV
jgi:hypothetical protein